MKYAGKTEEERFWANVEMIPFHECWEWMATKTWNGYGQFVGTTAHRVSFKMFNGPIKIGHWIDHICKNRGCVNPRHLRQVTPRENAIYNSDSVYAKNHAKTHCINGHEFTKENTWLKPRNEGGRKLFGRNCRTCKRASEIESSKKYYHTKGKILRKCKK